jgi:argininosuccinate lyase
VPRALDLSIRVTRLMTGVVGTLQVNVERMAHALDDGYTQATDLSEFIVQTCNIDYRSAYEVVGSAVRKASNEGIPGRHITGTMLDEAAMAVTGERLNLAARDLEPALDPRVIIETRRGTGGAAPAAVESMLAQCEKKADELRSAVEQRRAALDRTKRQLLKQARRIAEQEEEV